MTHVAQNAIIGWTEQGRVPDAIIRAGIGRLLARRLAEISADSVESYGAQTTRFEQAMDAAPIAPILEKANQQHY